MANPLEHQLSYPFGDQLPDAGTTLEIAPGVRWVRMGLPFALDHINLWLLADGEGWVIVDTGLGTSATREHWDHLFANTLRGKPVTRIIVTHYHPDHAGNAGWLMLVAAFILASVATRSGHQRKQRLGIGEARGGRRGPEIGRAHV